MVAWDEIPDDLKEARYKTLYEVFTPAAPVARKDLFSGRSDQLLALNEATLQRGQHAVIYGERGVGKTSLAKVAKERVDQDRMFSAHVTCDSSDTFASIWAKVLGEIRLIVDSGDGEVSGDARQYLEVEVINPNAVRVVLGRLSQSAPIVVFIDEFDVVKNSDDQRAMAETVKMLSDQGILATVVLVGVAESVTDLIAQHESTERNFIQVPMPRMSVPERLDIIKAGMDVAMMEMEPGAAERIALVSQGLAQFVHLLAQRAAIGALNAERLVVTVDDVQGAIKTALADIHASVSNTYYNAVKSNQPTTLYPALLLACSLAVPDERGFFTARALVEPMSRVAGRQMEIPAFGPHLDRLATDRGPILEKVGEKRRFRYRFRNPLMQPYVLMKGLNDGAITFDDLQAR